MTTNSTTNSSLITQNALHLHRDYITNHIYFRIPYAVVMVLLFISTLTSGIFVIRTMCKRNMLQKKSWLYLFILTVADTGICLFEIPFIVIATVNENLLRYRGFCIASAAVLPFFSLISMYTLAAISLHRCRTISKPFESITETGKRDVVIFLLVTIIIDLFFALSPIFGFSRYTYMPGRKWCVFISRNPKADFLYALLVAVVVYITPISAIIFSSCRIFCVVKRQARIRRFSSRRDLVTEHMTMVKTIGLLIGGFFLLWTPTIAYFIAGMSRVPVPLWYSHCTYIIMMLQGNVNAAIYYFRHPMFKEELCRTFGRNRHRRVASRSQNSKTSAVSCV